MLLSVLLISLKGASFLLPKKAASFLLPKTKAPCPKKARGFVVCFSKQLKLYVLWCLIRRA